jgi:hypothetical protein
MLQMARVRGFGTCCSYMPILVSLSVSHTAGSCGIGSNDVGTKKERRILSPKSMLGKAHSVKIHW